MKTIPSLTLLLLSGIALILGAIHSFLFFNESTGLNFPIFILCIIGGGLLLTQDRQVKVGKTKTSLILLCVFFSAMVFVRASELLTFFNIVASILLLLLLVETHSGKKLKEYLPVDYFKIFFTPFVFVVNFFETLPELFSLKRLGIEGQKSKEIVRGTVMAIVAVLVFGFLFASADEVFGSIFYGLFSFDFSAESIGRVVMFAITTAFFIGAFSYMFKNGPSEDIDVAPVKNLGKIETSIMLVTVNAMFLGFILIQITYLFGGESQFLSQGLTYAEYARKGFFELVVVSILSYLVISFVEKRITRNENAHHNSFRVLSTVLVAQVIVILFSAFDRLGLYEEAYGFTTIRLYSHGLMIFIGIVLVLMSHHILSGGNRKKFTSMIFACIVLFLVCMNVINPDAFIAKKNLDRYAKTGKIDAQYLSTLSVDAVPYTYILMKEKNISVRNEFALNSQKFLKYSNWKSMRLMDSKAKKLIEPYVFVIDEARSALEANITRQVLPVELDESDF